MAGLKNRLPALRLTGGSARSERRASCYVGMRHRRLGMTAGAVAAACGPMPCGRIQDGCGVPPRLRLLIRYCWEATLAASILLLTPSLA